MGTSTMSGIAQTALPSTSESVMDASQPKPAERVAHGAFWARWRVRTSYPLALLCFWLARPTPQSLLLGAAIAVVGLAIRAAAAGYLRKGEGLATEGPYAHTRNPLYFGSAILAAGLAVAARSWIAAALIAVYFAVFYMPVMRREEKEMRAAYGNIYEQYVARVPLFFPALRSRAGAQGKFSWELYRGNREYKAAIGTVLVVAILCARMWARAKWSI
jgi:protein-S-isoprenylcysteine O-methyltransferase Ste14